MTMRHNGFTFSCDVNSLKSTANGCESFTTTAKTERTAIAHARDEGWFVGTIRITKGAPKSKVQSVRRILCPFCSYWIGVP